MKDLVLVESKLWKSAGSQSQISDTTLVPQRHYLTHNIYFGMDEHGAKTKNRLALPGPAARGGPNGRIS